MSDSVHGRSLVGLNEVTSQGQLTVSQGQLPVWVYKGENFIKHRTIYFPLLTTEHISLC